MSGLLHLGAAVYRGMCHALYILACSIFFKLYIYPCAEKLEGDFRMVYIAGCGQCAGCDPLEGSGSAARNHGKFLVHALDSFHEPMHPIHKDARSSPRVNAVFSISNRTEFFVLCLQIQDCTLKVTWGRL